MANSQMLRKALKALHEVGGIGVMGSFACCIVLLTKAPVRSAVAFAVVQQAILSITQWLLLPSLAIVLISGLLAIAATDAFKDAGWAWFKALLGVSMFEGTLLTINASARQAAELSAQIAAGQGDSVELSRVLHTEWGGLWVLMALAVANIVLAVWRPRLYRPGPR